MDESAVEGWRQADAVFEALLALPPERRGGRLAELAPDSCLRRRVQRMLDQHAGGDGVLDHPEALPLPTALPTGLVGRRLGRWVLEQEIGRGGMSVVYRARAVEGPVGQDAAVKVLTLGALADLGRERFLHEQDALLRLRHPYIAPLYDAGVAEDGTPWLAMARVEGERIDAWCDRRGLDVASRVVLVLQVCEAVASAHRSLVVHRDIKPSNVLVGNDGHVGLLDFGIARFSDAGSERTATALRALTPEYASPEQFAGAPASTAMDVYGIGALSYRLLAGQPPHAARVRDAGGVVPPPSRVVRDDAALEANARNERRRAVRGDLDAIVMKALAPEPGARYASVEALADDLKRWLDGLPVLAQAPGWRYRLRKFVARNKLAVAGSLVLMLVLAGGVGATLWQAREAREAAVAAERMAEQRRLAQQKAEQALKRSNAIRDFLFELFRNNIPGGPLDQVPTTLELLRNAVDSVDERFPGDPETQAEFLATIAAVHDERRIPGGEELLRRTLALREQRRHEAPVEHAVVQSSLARSLPPERADEKEMLHEQAIAALERYAPGSLQLARAYEARGHVLNVRRDVRARLRDKERAWAIVSRHGDAERSERFRVAANLAVGYHGVGEYRQAVERYDDALGLARELNGDVHAQNAGLLGNRGGAYSSLGMFDQAQADLRASLEQYREVLEQPNDHVLASLWELEAAAYRRGDFAAALEWRSQWDRAAEKVAQGGAQTRLRARSDVWRARSLAGLGRSHEAASAVERGVAVLGADPGAAVRERANLLLAHSLRLRLACIAPDRPGTGSDHDLARVLELAPAEETGVKAYAAAEGYALAAACTLRKGDTGQALALFDRAAQVDAQLPPGHAAVVAERMLWHGRGLRQAGRSAEARAMWAQGMQRMRSGGFGHHPVHAQLVAEAARD